MKYVEEWFLAGARDSNRKMWPNEMRQQLFSIYAGFFFIPTDETTKKYGSRLFQGSTKATKLEGDEEEQEARKDEEEPSTGRRQIPKEIVSEIEHLLGEDISLMPKAVLRLLKDKFWIEGKTAPDNWPVEEKKLRTKVSQVKAKMKRHK
jgi:hypothetical protein